MKLGKGLLLVLALTLGVGTAFAQSIDVVGDPAGLTCSATYAVGTQYHLYIIARQGPAAPDGFTGVEFFVRGFPAGWFVLLKSPNPASNINLGEPFVSSGGIERVNQAYPVCQAWPASGFVVLYDMLILPMSVVPQTYLTVEIGNPPSNAAYTGPIFTLCDAPEYTAIPVAGGQFIINPAPGVTCTVGVEDKTWGQVKALY